MNETKLDGIELVSIPAGAFWMGSPDDDEEGFAEERPRHRRTLAVGFFMARHPVTVGQWREFCTASDGYERDEWWIDLSAPVHHRAEAQSPAFDFVDHPAHNVSWYEAAAFCRWLTARWRTSGRLRADQIVRLPSESEWERAARGPAGANEAYTRWPWGDVLTPAHANYVDAGFGRTTPVGAFPAGRVPEWGLEDMFGNVWEWTSTKWVQNYAEYAPEEDLCGEQPRVLRGGAWYFGHPLARCAFRGSDAPEYRNYRIGFRVAVAAAG
jgi:iron(II)-dependent oxidoreductase